MDNKRNDNHKSRHPPATNIQFSKSSKEPLLKRDILPARQTSYQRKLGKQNYESDKNGEQTKFSSCDSLDRYSKSGSEFPISPPVP